MRRSFRLIGLLAFALACVARPAASAVNLSQSHVYLPLVGYESVLYLTDVRSTISRAYTHGLIGNVVNDGSDTLYNIRIDLTFFLEDGTTRTYEAMPDLPMTRPGQRNTFRMFTDIPLADFDSAKPFNARFRASTTSIATYMELTVVSIEVYRLDDRVYVGGDLQNHTPYTLDDGQYVVWFNNTPLVTHSLITPVAPGETREFYAEVPRYELPSTSEFAVISQGTVRR